MTSTLPGADIRGFYDALGIALPEWATVEASVRCFADPAAHAHEDRDPSCSVNLEIGAWRCWGCGAKGGAYDAATWRGRSPREAMDLLVSYGIAPRRPPGGALNAPTGCSTASHASGAGAAAIGAVAGRRPARRRPLEAGAAPTGVAAGAAASPASPALAARRRR